MLRSLIYKWLPLIAILLITKLGVYSQGSESFTNLNASAASYVSGSYVGDGGVTWTYNGARTVTATDNITGTSIGFGSSGTRNVYASSGVNGVGTISYSVHSYFTGGAATDRTMELWVNGTLYDTYTLPAMSTTYTRNIAVNVAGNVTIEFRSTGTRQIVLDDVSWTADTGGCPNTEPTSNASAYVISGVGCDGFYLQWTQPASADGCMVVVKAGSDVITDPVDFTTYTASTTFGAGTDIGTGEFVVYSGSNTGTWILGLTASTTYYVNVFAYSGTSGCIDYRTIDELSQFQATSTCSTAPHLTTALINGCDATSTCSEGDQEMLFFNSGSYTVSTSTANISVTYGSVSPPTTNYAGSFTSVPTALSYMNSQAGCSGVFIDATTVSYVPSNSMMIMVNSSICSDAFNWSSLCSSVSGNVYIFFSSDPNWSSSGQFSNSPSVASPRYFGTTFAGQTVNYTYNSIPSGDGAYATWGATGGMQASSGANGCSLPTTVLPIELISFNGLASDKYNELSWQTSTEINNDYYVVERSTDGIEFSEIGTVGGSGTSLNVNNYAFEDIHPELLTYYRLKQVDFNGNYTYSNVIVVKRKSTSNAQVYNSGDQLVIRIRSEKPAFVEIVNVAGQVMYSKEIVQNLTLPIDQFIKGIYFVRIRSELSIETYKVKL